MTTPRKRVISGMRPTGRLHIGHYFGALANWIKLQNDPAYECFYFIADWHALTSDYADTSQIAQNTIEIATDWLAAGLDPVKSTFFVQSQVPEHAELHLLLSMVTPLGWLERVPTYKEQLDNIPGKDLHMYGFLGYPVLQTADIVMYGEEGVPLLVPVGEDQVSHVELSREVARRFNTFYGLQIDYLRWKNEDPKSLVRALSSYQTPGNVAMAGPTALYVREDISRAILRNQALGEGITNFRNRVGPVGAQFVSFAEVIREPEVMLTKTPRIPGTDGRKMSKSYGNAIMLTEDDESIRARAKVMMTDPDRKRRTDKGNPEVCPVYDWHKLFSPRETLDWSAHGCRTAEIGCIECKAAMADNLIKWIAPVRARRLEYEKHPEKVKKILADGSAERARPIAQQTMRRVREAVFGAASVEAC
jgi:tryptophanyl-tRNA synthetase